MTVTSQPCIASTESLHNRFTSISLLALSCCTLYLTASTPQCDKEHFVSLRWMSVLAKIGRNVAPSCTVSFHVHQCGLLLEQIQSEPWWGVEIVKKWTAAWCGCISITGIPADVSISWSGMHAPRQSPNMTPEKILEKGVWPGSCDPVNVCALNGWGGYVRTPVRLRRSPHLYFVNSVNIDGTCLIYWC